MRLINETNSEAELVRLNRDDDSTAAALIVKSSYSIERGRPSFSRRQRPLLREPTVIAGALFEPERVLRKRGVDVVIAGAALAPSSATRLMGVGAAVGQWRRHALVFGDRVWQRRRWQWSASDPASFSELPMTWTNAFGGVARSGGTPVPHQGNPSGKGYAIDVDAQIEGELLPNIEDPDALLEQPGQLVEPFGFAPLPSSSAIRLTAALDDTRVAGVDHSIFNVAHPKHRVTELCGGERCELYGWAGMPAASFELPADAFVVEITIGDRRHELCPRIDTLYILPTTREVVVIQRVTFTYQYIRTVARVARLRLLDSNPKLPAGVLGVHEW